MLDKLAACLAFSDLSPNKVRANPIPAPWANPIITVDRTIKNAITSSTLATVAVFLPMGLLSGGLQDFLMPFALTVSYSLLASLLVAITVVPVMSSWLLKSTKFKEHKPSEKFKSILTWSLNRKWVPLGLSFLIMASTIGIAFVLPQGAVESSNASFVNEAYLIQMKHLKKK
jgi:multidrug efflux pump subunit AcrB